MGDALASWNGLIKPLSQLTVSPLDRGYCFGDGVYEVIALLRGQPWLMEDHLVRLGNSLEGLKIVHDSKGVASRIRALLNQSSVQDGMIYLQITRGTGPREHVPKHLLTTNELMYIDTFDEDSYRKSQRDGVLVMITEDLRWGRCDVKSLNLLGNVLAQMKAKDAGCHEALQVTKDHLVTEGTRTNVFFVKDACLITPSTEQNILPGITRKSVMALARQAGVNVREERVPRSLATGCDEAFLTGTLSEILPIVKVDDRLIGGGVPGPVTRKLQEMLGAAKRAGKL